MQQKKEGEKNQIENTLYSMIKKVFTLTFLESAFCEFLWDDPLRLRLDFWESPCDLVPETPPLVARLFFFLPAKKNTRNNFIVGI